MQPPPTRILFAVAAAAAALPAQPPLKANAFVPNEHRNVGAIDLAAMRASGVWDEVEVGVLKAMLADIEKHSGFALRDVDRVTMVSTAGEGDLAGERRDRRVVVVEGNKPLGVEPWVAAAWTATKIGGVAVRQHGDELFVQPRPELRVTGADAIVRPVLEGKPHAGVPAADLMSLLSARSERIVHYVWDLANPTTKREMVPVLLPGAEWPDGDAPSFLCAQILVRGEPADAHLWLEATIRHAKAEAGLAATEAAVGEALGRWRKDPKLQMVRRALQGATIRRDRGDLVLTADLGRMRDAVGQLATFALAYAFAAPPAAAAPPPPPLPPPPPKKH
jgi:hypothetical protein